MTDEFKKALALQADKEKSWNYNIRSISDFTSGARWAKDWFEEFDPNIVELVNKIESLQSENTKLKKIIAKCPNENDDLGAEYTHVIILKEELEKVKAETIIDTSAHENLLRNLKRANERIVEFEDIKKAHLVYVDKITAKHDRVLSEALKLRDTSQNYFNLSWQSTPRELNDTKIALEKALSNFNKYIEEQG